MRKSLSSLLNKSIGTNFILTKNSLSLQHATICCSNIAQNTDYEINLLW